MTRAMKLDLTSTLTLNNGVEMPRLGLGVYQSTPGDETRQAVLAALECGYRHIDTAQSYRNERDVGLALRQSGIPREKIFVTTKLWTRHHGYDSTLRACEKSLKELGIDQLDLYLIHWPGSPVRRDTWRAMVQIFRLGKAKASGVSNYREPHLKEILDASDITPAVNQVEFSPFLHQRNLLDFCREHGVQVEAYAPLTQGKKLGVPSVVSIAKKHGKTGAQVLIRWALQQDLVVIPKSVRPLRIRENAAVYDFTLDASDMKVLDNLNENFRTCWDPTDIR